MSIQDTINLLQREISQNKSSDDPKILEIVKAQEAAVLYAKSILDIYTEILNKKKFQVEFYGSTDLGIAQDIITKHMNKVESLTKD